MAAPAWATNLLTFWDTAVGPTTVTALGGGGAGLGNDETDFFIESTSCLSKAAWTNAVKGFIVDALGTTFTVPDDGAIILYAKYDAAGSLATKANGGFRMVFGDADTDYYHSYIGGSDTLAFDSWYPYVLDPNTSTVDNTTGSPSGSWQWIGILGNLPTTSGPTKGNPIAIDAIRYGRCDVEYTGGGGGDPDNTFSGAEAWANDPTRRLGLIQLSGAYFIQGFHSLGTGGGAVVFSDSNKTLYWRRCDGNLTNDAVSTAFNRIEILHTDSVVTMENITIQALGTRAKGQFVHTEGTLNLKSCQFVDMSTFSFISASTVDTTTFRRCEQITAVSSILTDCNIIEYTGVANTSALVWSAALDPNTKLRGTSFTMGTLLTHAIEFGTSSPLTMTLTDMFFTGYHTTLNNQNDSTFHIKRTTGTVTSNIVGGTSAANLTYRSDGATVIIQSVVSISLTNIISGSTLGIDAIFTTATVGAS